jgi:hypothetical protein
MKKLVIILTLLCLSLIICQAQDLSIIQNGQNYLLVRSQKNQQTKVDSTQLKKLTIITISNEFIPVSSVQTTVKNLVVLNKLIVNNYELVKERNILVTDSVINNYNISKPWLKERIRRIYNVKQEADVIYCDLSRDSKSMRFNFEFLLLLISLILIISTDYTNLKALKNRWLDIMFASFLLIIFISSPYPELLANLINSIFMTLMFLLVFHILGKMGVPIKIAIIATYSLMSGYMQHDKLFGLLTIAIGCLTIIIGWLIKSKRKSAVILNEVADLEEK